MTAMSFWWWVCLIASVFGFFNAVSAMEDSIAKSWYGLDVDEDLMTKRFIRALVCTVISVLSLFLA